MIARRTRLLALASTILAAGLWGDTGSIADDVDVLDRKLLEALEGRPSADSTERIVPRLIQTTKSAARRIGEGQLDDETFVLQQQILADIDALLKQAAPPNQPPSGSPASPLQQPQDPSAPQQQQGPPSPDSQNQPDDENDPNSPSKESQQRTTPGVQGEVDGERRLGLSTSAWGHLPPKVREQMRSAFAEEYLPEYDSLVRRYYETLARRRSAESDRLDQD